MDVLHRLGGKKRKSSARLPRAAEEEEWLHRSLKNRPVEIRTEYDQSVAKFGRRFQVGDDTAHSSLAHTLLMLNTGLVNIISHALSEDHRSMSTSRSVLFHLSETAAVDTLTALAQLNSRLALASQIRLPLDHAEDTSKRHHRHPRESRKTPSFSPSKQPQRPPPAPLLVSGGWVRSKSGSFVVSPADAKKARKQEKAGKHGRSKSESQISKLAVPKASSSAHKISKAGSEAASKHPGHSSGLRLQDNDNSQRTWASESQRPQRQPSMLVVPGDMFEEPQAVVEQPPPRPPKIPLHTRSIHRPRAHEARPISTMTFMTASTKVGEIPESRLPDRLPGPDEAARRMPYTIPPPLEASEPKRKKGFRFWKKDVKDRAMSTC
jgi:hypothetical protein